MIDPHKRKTIWVYRDSRKRGMYWRHAQANAIRALIAGPIYLALYLILRNKSVDYPVPIKALKKRKKPSNYPNVKPVQNNLKATSKSKGFKFPGEPLQPTATTKNPNLDGKNTYVPSSHANKTGLPVPLINDEGNEVCVECGGKIVDGTCIDCFKVYYVFFLLINF